MIVYGDDGIVCRMVLHTGRIIAHMLAFMHLLQTHTDTPHWNWFRSIFVVFICSNAFLCLLGRFILHTRQALSSMRFIMFGFIFKSTMAVTSLLNQNRPKTSNFHLRMHANGTHMHKHTHTHHRNQRLQCDLKNAEWAAIITVILFFLFSSFFFRKDFPFCEWSNTKWHSNMLIILYENYSSTYAHMHNARMYRLCVWET